MKILGISGSNRKEGSSYLLLREMFKDLSFESKIVQIAELQVKPCELCFELCAQKPFECVLEDDLEMIFEEMKSSDAIVLACPFYFYIPSRFQAFIERLGCLDYFTEEKHGKGRSPLVGKPCGLIAVSASGGGFNAFQVLHLLQEFALMLGMRPVIGNTWPYTGLSAKSGDIDKDAILKETDTIKKAKDYLKLLVRDIEK